MNGSKQRARTGAGWREPILRHFTPEIAAASRLTIVADPDLLLTEQEILDALRSRGYDLIPFDDHVAFRFAYESLYRQLWDRGEKTNLVVVLRTPRDDLDALPYDLLEQARRHERCLSFTIAALFPNLDPNIVAQLERSDFDVLYKAQEEQAPGQLGVNATKDFILRHVFKVAPELIERPADLLHVLLRRHYRGVRFPTELDERFVHQLRQSGRWTDWPLEQIVPSCAAFLDFLQERWPIFLRSRVASHDSRVGEPETPYELRFEGPADIPFDHDDVRIYIDNLFLEGYLEPTAAVEASQVPAPWMLVGVVGADMGGDGAERFKRLLGRLKDELPGRDASHRGWADYARVWAEWAALRWELGNDPTGTSRDDWETLHDAIEASFASWMTDHFASLHNLSFVQRPAMVHHVPHYIARRFTATGAGAPGAKRARHALVVVDGLALDQWVPLRAALREQLGPDTVIEEDASFAWVPTLTGVSRQSIFAGEPPFFFGSTLGSTHKEKSHWQRFWEERGAQLLEIGYACQKKQEPDETFLERGMALSSHPKMRLLGLVVGTVDQSMHGLVTGTSGLHSIIRDWAKSGTFGRLIGGLLDDGFEVFITADHGNIAGSGIGKPNVGAIADERGERVHVFVDDRTREKVRAEFPESLPWPQIGLPEAYRPLLAPGRTAFIHEGKTTVAHGGIAMEEVIVPFVRVERGGS